MNFPLTKQVVLVAAAAFDRPSLSPRVTGSGHAGYSGRGMEEESRELLDNDAEGVLVQAEPDRFGRLATQFEVEMVKSFDHLATHFGRGQRGAWKFVL